MSRAPQARSQIVDLDIANLPDVFRAAALSAQTASDTRNSGPAANLF